MTRKITRWGILGAAQIARKNWLAIRNSGNGIVAAVASRQLATAAQFIAECQARAPFAPPPQAIGSYEELIASPDIDAVYIPLPTGLRKKWVIAAAKAGKHVLCEKPCAVSAADLEEMLAACRRARVQFMDGVMFMHSRRLEELRRAINDTVGQMRRLTLAFTFNAPANFFATNIRADASLEPHGCLGDLGWYCLRFALWAVGWKMPRHATGRILAPSKSPKTPKTSPAGPLEFSGELLFDNAVSAGFYCSFLTENQQLAQISGDRGFFRLSDFVLPFYGSEVTWETFNSAYTIDSCDFHMEPRRKLLTLGEYSDSHPTSQETNMFRNFAAQIQTRRLNPEWPRIALQTQRVMETCLASARGRQD
jgi:predicted dehydrogenase